MDLQLLNDTFHVPSWLLGAIGVLSLLYLYLARRYSYWKVRGVPSIRPYPLISSFSSFFSQPFHCEEMKRYKKYGRLYGSFEGKHPVLSVSEPDLLKNVLVKDFHAFEDRRNMATGDPIGDKMLSVLTGEEWNQMRSTLTPAFTSGKLRKISSIINDCSKTLVDNFLEAARKGIPVDCKRLFGDFVMDVIFSSAFGTKIDPHHDTHNPMASMARKVFSRNRDWRFLMTLCCPSLMRLLRIKPLNPSINEFFKDVTLQLIQERKENGKPREDFLQLLVDASKGIEMSGDLDSSLVDMGHEEENWKVFKRNSTNKSLSNEEVVAQCVLFFLVGYDTVASTLSLAAYSLAENPECQERLIKEVDEVFTKHKEITYENVKKMQYLDRFVSETLRKYPPVVRIDRKARVDYNLGGTGITIPKDMIVTIPIYAIHYDEEHYPEPDKFDPDRFLPENQAMRNPYSYLPFGAGPRNCIGMRFAVMELKLCIAHILHSLRFKACQQTRFPLKFHSGNSLLVPKELTLAVEVRKDIPPEDATLRLYFTSPRNRFH